MTIIAIVGINWGDEGKGRIVDYLAAEADFVVRCQGGANAGHTVVNDFGLFKSHLVPSGIFRPEVVNVLGPGMLVDLEATATEIDGLRARGIDTSNLRISDRATICFPFHRWEDEWEEERLGADKFGSTQQGVAPGYADRYLKKGVQIGELLFPDQLRPRLARLVEWKNLVAKGVFGKTNAIDFYNIWMWIEKYGEPIKGYVRDTSAILEQAERDNKSLILEGQLGALRDVTFGIYPFTTSSSTLASYALIGAGLPSSTLDCVVGVIKAYSTCVGAGPFVTEMPPEQASQLRETAFEYGASTGRPRRIGHFDAEASRYGVWLQGATELALTKLDSLTGVDPLLICTDYHIGGKTVDRFPLNPELAQVQPVYARMSGWRADITGVRKFEQLPVEAKKYVLEIERLMQRSIRLVSVGPKRESIIKR